MTTVANKGIIDRPSHHTVEQTVDGLKTVLRPKGVTLFAVIDHSGEAAKVGMHMRPTKLLIFGSPKAGTALILAAPSSAIDLHNSPEYLKNRHGFPSQLLANIVVVETLAGEAAE